MVDEDGRIIEGRRYRHDERGITALCRRLLGLEVELVAIERPDGPSIERLLDAGVSVIAIHPNQVAAMRPRFSAAGGKSDSFDSFVLAELACTDSHRYRIRVPDSDATKALRALSCAREDLVGTRVALANELRAQLGCFWPAPRTCSARSTARSRWRSSSSIPRPWRPVVSVSSAWRGSLRATATAAARPRASCSGACATPRRDAPGRSRPAHAGRSCSHWSLRLNPSSPRSRSSPRRSAAPR